MDLAKSTAHEYLSFPLLLSPSNELTRHRYGLDPVALLHAIRESQAALVAVSSPDNGEVSPQESLDQFLAQLPSCKRRR